MGRSRARAPPVIDEGSHRSKRKKTVPSNLGGREGAASANSVPVEVSDGKAALYHCNYCNKDISGTVRIKCAVCPDFDLCIECFSVGAETTPHKSNHPYKVMDNLSFPLICPEWNADEEILLLEGIAMYGFGNWTEVSEHVGTKSRMQCINHYNAVYMSSPCFPLPDMSHVMGKNRDELLAMAKGDTDIKKESPASGELMLKEEPPSSSRIKNEEARKEDLAHKSLSMLNVEIGSHLGSTTSAALPDAVKKASNSGEIKDSIKLEEHQSDRRIGEKKPRASGEEGPCITELCGYNIKRQEFEIEYDNDAEQLLADMEFKDTDTAAEKEVKLQVLRTYAKRLDERKRRKDFILERNLLYPDAFEMSLSPDEKEIYQRYKVFMRFHTKEEHEQLMKSVIEEHRIVKRIHDLQEARAAGCHTSAEANRFIEQKTKKEAESTAQRLKESMQAGTSGKAFQRPSNLKGELESSPRGGVREATGFHPSGKDSTTNVARQAISSTLDDWDISGFTGVDLLSESERRLCCELRILPAHYLSMLQTLSEEIMKGSVTKKSDAHGLFKVEAGKVDKIYDMLVEKGIAHV